MHQILRDFCEALETAVGAFETSGKRGGKACSLRDLFLAAEALTEVTLDDAEYATTSPGDPSDIRGAAEAAIALTAGVSWWRSFSARERQKYLDELRLIRAITRQRIASSPAASRIDDDDYTGLRLDQPSLEHRPDLPQRFDDGQP